MHFYMSINCSSLLPSVVLYFSLLRAFSCFLCVSLCFCVVHSGRIVQKEVGGSKFFFRWGVERRGGGRIVFRHGVEKEVGGRILSSIIEERGKLHNKLSIWCKSLIRNRFKGGHTVCHSNI